MKTKVNSDVILGILLIVVSAAIFMTANTYPSGAALYPKGLAVLIAILSLSIVWTGIKLHAALHACTTMNENQVQQAGQHGKI